MCRARVATGEGVSRARANTGIDNASNESTAAEGGTERKGANREMQEDTRRCWRGVLELVLFGICRVLPKLPYIFSR